jgi:hypothetical protein
MSDYIVLAIAVFGFTYLVRFMDGPFDIFIKFRELVGIKYVPTLSSFANPEPDTEEIPDKFFAKLVGCFWCFTTWISIFFCVAFAIVYARGIFDTIAGIFICVGISGFAYEKMTDK